MVYIDKGKNKMKIKLVENISDFDNYSFEQFRDMLSRNILGIRYDRIKPEVARGDINDAADRLMNCLYDYVNDSIIKLLDTFDRVITIDQVKDIIRNIPSYKFSDQEIIQIAKDDNFEVYKATKNSIITYIITVAYEYLEDAADYESMTIEELFGKLEEI